MSESTTEKERTGALAGVSSAQAIGFILGPGEFSDSHMQLFNASDWLKVT